MNEAAELRSDGEANIVKAPKLRLAINGKFLSQTSPRSGVYRVAYEIMLALDRLLSNDPELAERVSCCVIVPGSKAYGLSLKTLSIEYSDRVVAKIDSRLWEQFVLPWMAKGRTLLNLCNLGPVAYGNAFTMMHDAQVRASPDSYSLAFRLWYGLIQPRLARRNRAILTVSAFSRDQLDHYGIVGAGRVRVVHNGCDHVLRLKAEHSAIQRFGLERKKYVIALANTQKHKNIGVLFEAFQAKNLDGITLALFGSASRDDFEKLGHVVPQSVKFLGRIQDDELSGLLRGAIALAFPSLTEGFGLPPLEAMVLGCPVVAAPCGALVEVCGDAVLWADPYAPNEWAAHISFLHSNPDQAASIVDAGYIHAANFTWENAARRLIEVVANEEERGSRCVSEKSGKDAYDFKAAK